MGPLEDVRAGSERGGSRETADARGRGRCIEKPARPGPVVSGRKLLPMPPARRDGRVFRCPIRHARRKAELIDGPVLIDQGIDRPRIISPHDIWRSIAFMRVNTVDDIKMPPVARETIDRKGVMLLQDWITSMPGRSVLAPPAMSPQGGT